MNNTIFSAKMKLIFVLLLLAIGSTYGTRFYFGDREDFSHGSGSISKRLFNGSQITIEKAPYMAVVEADKSFMSSYPFATAVIITNRYLLSTAEFFVLQRGKHMRAYLGTSNINLAKPENKYEVEQVITHNDYYYGSFLNDIALIKLKDEIEFNNLHRPIALISSNEVLLDQVAELKILGYGYTDKIGTENSLGILTCKIKRVNMKHVKYTKHNFAITMNPRMCPGDHGDPLVLKNKLVGLAVFTDGCKKYADPKVSFTGIRYFRSWISKQVGKKSLQHAVKNAFPKKYEYINEIPFL